VADGERERVDGVGRLQLKRPLGVLQSVHRKLLPVGVRRLVGHHVGILLGNFLDDEGIVGLRGVRLLVELQRAHRVQLRLRGLGLAQQFLHRRGGQQGVQGQEDKDGSQHAWNTGQSSQRLPLTMIWQG
jgi:hypothetical protein